MRLNSIAHFAVFIVAIFAISGKFHLFDTDYVEAQETDLRWIQISFPTEGAEIPLDSDPYTITISGKAGPRVTDVEGLSVIISTSPLNKVKAQVRDNGTWSGTIRLSPEKQYTIKAVLHNKLDQEIANHSITIITK